MPIKTLIVDDNAGIRELLRTVASMTDDFEIVGEAENGELGIAAAQWHCPELIVLDVSMPVMSGLEALPEIQKVCPGAKVVLLTAFEKEVVDVPDGVQYINKNGELLWIFEELRGAVDSRA